MSNNDAVPLDMLLKDPFYAFGRVLKTENINLISRFKDEFLQEQQFYKSKLNIYDLQQKIFDRYFNETAPVENYNHELLLKLVGNSRFKDEEQLAVKHAIAWMLTTVQRIKDLSAYEPGQVTKLNDNFHEVLSAVKRIFSHSDNDGQLNYIFFIEYQNSPDGRKVYVVSDLDHDQNEQPDKGGLVSYMFDGLLDAASGSIQTLIPVINRKAEDNEPHASSFVNKFYIRKKETTGEAIDAGVDADKNNAAYNAEPGLNINDLFKLDADKYPQIKNAGMLQYFRLSEIDLEVTGVADKGKAVLVICNNETPEKGNFTRFLNIEKMRLLLLIKEEMLHYLKTLITNDAFNEMINYAAVLDTNRSMKHGINTYLNALKYYIPQENAAISDILVSAIQGQIYSRNELQLELEPEDQREVKNPKNKFVEIINTVCNDELLGYQRIKFCQIRIHHFPEKMYNIILNVVLPEILINMKKNHPAGTFVKPLFSVEVNGNIITFRNRTLNNVKVKNLQQIERFHGLHMCQKILARLNYVSTNNPKPLDVKYDENLKEYTLILNLNKDREKNIIY